MLAATWIFLVTATLPAFAQGLTKHTRLTADAGSESWPRSTLPMWSTWTRKWIRKVSLEARAVRYVRKPTPDEHAEIESCSAGAPTSWRRIRWTRPATTAD